MKRKPKRHGLPRVAAASLALLAMIRTGTAAPDDAQRIATPGVPTVASGGAVPRSVGLGEVSSKTGEFRYRHPIAVPPGRAGMAPDLALSYSSNGALFGDVAAGWSLELPTIYRDRGLPGDSADKAPAWRSSLAGGARLVSVVEPGTSFSNQSFRAWGDTSFTRYRRIDDTHWEARTLTDIVHRFVRLAETTASGEPFVLESTTDRFGNTVSYSWLPYAGSQGTTMHYLSSIEYTSNTALGSAGVPHAKVLFDYLPIETCAGAKTPTGATLEPLAGTNGYLRGARPLSAIRTQVRDTPTSGFRAVRTVQLTYQPRSCSAGYGPMRLLANIQESATSPAGVVSTMPKLTFTYGTPGQMPRIRQSQRLPNRGGVLTESLAGRGV